MTDTVKQLMAEAAALLAKGADGTASVEEVRELTARLEQAKAAQAVEDAPADDGLPYGFDKASRRLFRKIGRARKRIHKRQRKARGRQ